MAEIEKGFSESLKLSQVFPQHFLALSQALPSLRDTKSVTHLLTGNRMFVLNLCYSADQSDWSMYLLEIMHQRALFRQTSHQNCVNDVMEAHGYGFNCQ